MNLQVTPIPASTNVTVSWTSQDAVTGSSTDYDIVTGLASQLNADGDYSRASCLISDDADTPYVDTRPNPPPGDAYYYLVRAENPCRSGGYGHTSPSDPRAALGGNIPCL